MIGISIQYEIGDDIPCTYISSLENMLSDSSNSKIRNIERILDSIVDSEIKDIVSIKDTLSNSSNMMMNGLISFKDIFSIARKLSRDFDFYTKKLKVLNQITTISFNGLDEDKIVELEDTVNDHKILLKKNLDSLTEAYKKLFTNADDSFKQLDESKKNLIIDMIKKNIPDTNDSTIVQENKLLDIIFGIASGTVAFAKNVIVKHWLLIASAFGINYLTNNSLINALSDLVSTASNVLTVSVISFVIFVGVCIVICIYHNIYDYVHTKENEKISAKIDELNATSTNNIKDSFGKKKLNLDTKTSQLNTDKASSFRGFNNTASYNPNSNGTDPKLDIF